MHAWRILPCNLLLMQVLRMPLSDGSGWVTWLAGKEQYVCSFLHYFRIRIPLVIHWSNCHHYSRIMVPADLSRHCKLSHFCCHALGCSYIFALERIHERSPRITYLVRIHERSQPPGGTPIPPASRPCHPRRCRCRTPPAPLGARPALLLL